VDGTFWTRVTADQPRPVLEAEGAAAHGFSVPHALRPGQQVEAWALGARSDGSRDRQAVALAGSPATTPDGYLAPGVVHQAIADPAGPFAIHLVTVTLAAPSTVDLALALDVLPGLETTSSMARRRGATVAVNGDYADPDHGRPAAADAVPAREQPRHRRPGGGGVHGPSQRPGGRRGPQDRPRPAGGPGQPGAPAGDEVAVLVLAGPTPAVPPTLPPPAALAPEADQAAQQTDLEAIAADPGSSAGLLQWLTTH
jgi:hypothetical protein